MNVAAIFGQISDNRNDYFSHFLRRSAGGGGGGDGQKRFGKLTYLHWRILCLPIWNWFGFRARKVTEPTGSNWAEKSNWKAMHVDIQYTLSMEGNRRAIGFCR